MLFPWGEDSDGGRLLGSLLVWQGAVAAALHGAGSLWLAAQRSQAGTADAAVGKLCSVCLAGDGKKHILQ